MRNILKVLLILVVCLSLLALAGCRNKNGSTGETIGVTDPQETTAETQEQTTTEKPVNIVEDPLNNGEGNPLDAIDGTGDATGPVIDIEVEDDATNTTTAPTQGGNNQSGNNQGGTTEPTSTPEDDDLVVDFGDLVNGGK